MIRLVLRFWPGAERFHRDGRLDGLLQAVTFSLLLNVSFFSVFIWPDAFSPLSRTVVCLAVVVFWLASASWGTRRNDPSPTIEPAEQNQPTLLFQAAQREYLLGNWKQAEQYLQQLLRVNPHDIPARLRLAVLYRRAGRRAEAENELETLRRTAGAEKWHWEISRQQQRLGEGTNKSAA